MELGFYSWMKYTGTLENLVIFSKWENTLRLSTNTALCTAHALSISWAGLLATCLDSPASQSSEGILPRGLLQPRPTVCDLHQLGKASLGFHTNSVLFTPLSKRTTSPPFSLTRKVAEEVCFQEHPGNSINRMSMRKWKAKVRKKIPNLTQNERNENNTEVPGFLKVSHWQIFERLREQVMWSSCTPF